MNLVVFHWPWLLVLTAASCLAAWFTRKSNHWLPALLTYSLTLVLFIGALFAAVPLEETLLLLLCPMTTLGFCALRRQKP